MLFFTSSILELIVAETNRYAAECLGDEFQAWQQLTVAEFQAYTGFMILMGLVKMPSIYDYWQKDDIFHYAPIANKISRDRFFEIHRYLHFVNNATLAAPGTANYQKLGKIQPIIDAITKTLLRFINQEKMSLLMKLW